MRDLEFISGRFFDVEIPPEKQFLLKYFRTPLQEAFVRYFYVFGECRNFVDHTGYYCSERMVFRLKRRYLHLVKIHAEAKRALTEEGMELVHLIESGQIVLTHNGIS